MTAVTRPDNQKKIATAMTSEYIIAKYIRLSLDDGITESLSIPNQHMILDAHIDELEISNASVIEFVDNGYTGTNMERPALQEMLDLVRSGRVNCIVVKDFSRFSRNALESGYYVEQVFPLYHIRFISVSDRFDSNNYMNNTGGIDVAFKFLMHEYFSQDLSRKVKSAKRIQMARGENIVATTIYGYYKSDAGKWEPEQITADVVRLIYDLALQGIPPAVIKDKLFEAGYPTPREHQELKRGKDIVPTCHWETRRVKEILQNEQYIGTYISGKQNSKAVGSSSKNWTDRSEWIVIPDSHTPIISKEVFREVQTLMESHLLGSITQKKLKETWKDEVLPLINEHPKKKSQTKYPKRRRMMKGEFIAAVPIYGYAKLDDGSWEIDPQAAEVIRQIFDLTLQGYSEAEIAERLSSAGLPMPREHLQLAKGDDIEPTCGWKAKNVRNILVNIQYTGAYVSGRILTDADTGKKYRPPQNEWIVIPDKNTAIISKNFFDEVQAVIAENKLSRRKKQKARNYLLRGKVKCGCCDNGMTYDPITEPVFRCYKTAADPSAPCHKLKVVASELDEAVLNIIRKQAEVILNTTDLTGLHKTGGNAQQIAGCEKRLKALVEQRQRYYEQFITGEIDRQAHQSLKGECSAQIERLNSQLAAHRQSIYESQSSQRTAGIAKTVTSDTITEQEIVDMLIDKIHVFPNCHIEITWKVSGFAAV
jgi:DNA invertase Pin-like site-specific DNA recombinase